MTPRTLVFVLAFAILALAAWYVLPVPDLVTEAQALFSRENITLFIDRAGVWGPVAIIGLMTMAIVASPIPSAPIALAAGAAYGHYIGTVYVALGAELGAIIAFEIARTLGREPVRRFLGDRADYGLFGSLY